MAITYTPTSTSFGYAGGIEKNLQTAEMIGNATKNFIGTPMQQSENSLYQAQQKIESTVAVAMLVVGDYNQSKAINAFQQLNFSNSTNATSNYLELIGVHQNNNNFNYDIQVDNTLTGAHKITADKTTLTNQQLSELRTNGSMTLAGSTYRINREKVNGEIQRNNTSLVSRDAILSATKKSEQVEAMKKLYSQALNHMSTSSNLITISNARNLGEQTVLKRCEEVDYRLKEQLTSAIHSSSTLATKIKASKINLDKTLTSTQLNEIVNAIHVDSKLTAAEKTTLIEAVKDRNEIHGFVQSGIIHGGSVDKNRGKLAYGKGIVTKTIVGQEFYQGMKFVKMGSKVVSLAVKTAIQVPTNMSYTVLDNTLGATQTIAKGINSLAPTSASDLIERASDLGRKSLRESQARQRKIRSIHDKRERKNYIRNERLNKKEAIELKKLDRAKTKAHKTRAFGEKSKADKLDRRVNKLEQRHKSRLSRRQIGQSKKTFYQRFDDLGRSVKNVLKKPLTIIAKPITAVLDCIELIKKKLINVIVIPIAGIILKILGICMGFIFVVYFILHFISLEPVNNLTENLNAVNYMQLIVDIVQKDLSKNFEEIAKTDATIHYLSLSSDNNKNGGSVLSKKAEAGKVDIDFTNGNIPTNWFVMPNYGEIGKIWVWEESDNTTKWAKTANGKSTKDLVYTSDLVPSDDYTGYVAPKDRECLASVNENIIPIINLMHHRYLDSINFENWETALGYSYYMYVQSHDIARYDNNLKNTTIDDVHYTKKGYSYVYSNCCGRDTLYTSKPSWNGSSVINRDKESCTNVYVHGDEKILSLAVAAAKRLGTVVVGRNEDFFKKTIYELYSEKGEVDTFYKITRSSGYYIVDTTTEESPKQVSATGSLSDGVLNTIHDGKCTHYTIEQYGDEYLKCNITPHGSSCYNKKGVLICNNPLHDDNHVHEFKETDDSCYVRVCVCQGHCGGHLTPQVNISEKMTYEGLIQDDWFKTPHFLTAEEITSNDTTDILNPAKTMLEEYGLKTIKQWKGYWNMKAAGWYTPYPRSKWGLAKTIATASLGEFSAYQNPETENDIYEFAGWWSDTNVYDRAEIEILTHMYGSYYKPNGYINGDEKYKLAKEMWSEEIIGKNYAITFATGCGGTLTEAEISMYMEYFKSLGLNSSQLAILEDALRHVGAYYYSLTGAGHMNGINSDSGPSECSGFVSGVLSRALGKAFNYSAAGYANLGKKGITPQPGDILSHNNGGIGSNGQSYGGHVVIYAGYIENGPEGPGEYIIDCTSSGTGGSQFRRCKNVTTKYPYVYRP